MALLVKVDYKVLPERLTIPCKRKLNSEEVHGVSCSMNDKGELYHHTSFDNFLATLDEFALIPSSDPLEDGTVNFSANPNFHRFGAIRLVFDGSNPELLKNVQPMCYVKGEDERKLSNEVLRRIHEYEKTHHGETIGITRVENSQIGAEPYWVFKNECKYYSKAAISLNNVKRVEYWIPYDINKPESTAGTNVVPCIADYSFFATDREPEKNLQELINQVKRAKEIAEKDLQVPFQVKSCYPYIKTLMYRGIRLTEENLKKIENGIIPEEEDVRYVEPNCTCPGEEIPD